MKFRLSRHAEEELLHRRIPRDLVEEVLAHPQQVIDERQGMKAYQSRVEFPEGRLFLLRVIVSDSARPPVVVTAYRTRKIAKYWRQP